VPGYAIDDMNQYGGFTGVQTIQAAAALNEEAGELTVFVINADAAEEQELKLDARGFEGWQFTEHIEMFAETPDAQNTWDHPDRILPVKNPDTRAEKGILTARLKKESWNVLRFKK
jgi:alpha-N-arabinofuranosidase